MNVARIAPAAFVGEVVVRARTIRSGATLDDRRRGSLRLETSLRPGLRRVP